MITTLYNARILTIGPNQPEAWEVDIEDGRIVHVFYPPEHTSTKWRRTCDSKLIDMRGRLVVPGFNDCHMHILPYGLDLGKADLRPDAGVRDIEALGAALRKWTDANPQSEWILGSRYDQNAFPGATHPTRHDLDKWFPDRTVYCTQTSGHAAVCNSAALRVAGITRDTPNPPGGELVRDGAGEPTGVLLESAMDVVARMIPKPDRAAMCAAIQRACGELVRKGITSASDLHTGWLKLSEEVWAYEQAVNEGARVRMTLCFHLPAFGGPNEVIEYDPMGAGRTTTNRHGIRVGPGKLFSDGALTTRTAALREPYVDGTGDGMLLHEPDELKAYIRAAHDNGWQVATHAIGDRAMDLVLDAYAEAQSANPRPNARHRIEHAMLLDDGLIRRIKDQNVIPVVQPEFVARLGDAYVMGLGEERAARLNPTASLQRAGVGVPFSSDCPVVPGSPLDGIRAACRRTTPSGRVLGPDERITPLEAIRNYAYWAAYSTFDENETGQIKLGLRADLTVLDGELDDLDSLSVAATMIGGEFVYGADNVY